MKTSGLLLLIACLGGCSTERYDPFQAVYNGIKMNNEAKQTPQEKELKPTPSYDSYKQQRDGQQPK